MADFDIVSDALGRVRLACRARETRDPEGSARVSAHQGRLLGQLDDVDPVMVGELADHLGVTASTMSLTLKRLEGAGLIRRDRDPADRRVMNVRLTEAGVRARDAHAELDRARVADMLDLLAPHHRQDALRGLALLTEAAEALIDRRRRSIEAQLGGESA